MSSEVVKHVTERQAAKGCLACIFEGERKPGCTDPECPLEGED